MRTPLLAFLTLSLSLPLVACGPEPVRGPVVLPEGAVPGEAEAFLAASLEALGQRPEHEAQEVEVRHILIGVKHPRLPGVSRSAEEARAQAADLLQRLAAGEDMKTLVTGYSDDPPKPDAPGIYRMVLEGEGDPPAVMPRGLMVSAFGDVVWRLQVGEVGVAAHDRASSPFGYHIVKRLK